MKFLRSSKYSLNHLFACSFVVIALVGVFYFVYSYDKELQECKLKSRQIVYLHPQAIPLEKMPALDELDTNNLATGIKEMKNHKLIMTGITRDNAADWPIMVKHMEYLGGFFKDYRVIIFENDSTDGTKALLSHWEANNPKVQIISQDFFNPKRPSYKFMADVRNKYLESMASDSAYNDFDMVMIVDMDASYGFDVRGIQDSFAKIDKWDAVCSNGISTSKGKMFDMFAFRNAQFPSKPADGSLKYWFWDLHKGQISYPVNSPWVEVDSCFGGLAFYKREYIQDCYYDSIEEDCEHVAFHKCLKEKHQGRMFMNPNQMLKYSHFK